MGDGITRSRPPVPARYIAKKSLAIAGLGIAFGIAVGVVYSRPSKAEKRPEEDKGKPAPTQAVASIKDYDDQPPKMHREPLPEADGSDEMLRALIAKELEREKRAASARASAVTFQGISIPKEGRLEHAGFEDGPSSSNDQIAQDSRDDVNRQDNKLAFLTKAREGDTTLRARLKKPNSPYQLLAGTVIPGLLLTGINSDLPGQLLGQVSQDVYDSVTGKYLLVPQGTKVIGSYDSRIVYGQERVLAVWTRLVFPNGSSLSLEGMPGVDLSGYAGLSDQVDNHYVKLLSGVVLSSLLGAGAQVAEGRSYDTLNPSYAQLAVQGVARNANEVGQEITRRNLNIQPTLVIRPGFRFNVFVQKDMTLVPYSRK